MLLFIQSVNNSHLVLTTVVAILVALVAAGLLESKILTRINWADAGKAAGFVTAANMITPVLAFIFLVLAFLIFSIFSIKSYTDFHEQGALKTFVYLLFPILIIILRVRLLALLKIKRGWQAWLYSFVTTKINFWFIALFIYIFYELFKK